MINVLQQLQVHIAIAVIVIILSVFQSNINSFTCSKSSLGIHIWQSNILQIYIIQMDSFFYESFKEFLYCIPYILIICLIKHLAYHDILKRQS